MAKKFFADKGIPVELLSADGALEAAPAMGYADIILDLVSTASARPRGLVRIFLNRDAGAWCLSLHPFPFSCPACCQGTTLRENNLKMIEGGRILNSEGVLVASRKALLSKPGLLQLVKELIERLEAHLTAENYYSVIANFVGQKPEQIASRLLEAPGLQGLAGPTISPVYVKGQAGEPTPAVYAAIICVRKKELYQAVKSIRSVGGSAVLVQPITYIFDEEPARWKKLCAELGVDAAKCAA